MSFRIVLKRGCSLRDGCFLEYISLSKIANEEIKLDWSVNFGHQMGAHTPGAGGSDTVLTELFIHYDQSELAAYLSDRHKDFITYDEVYYNPEVQTLFELCAEE